MTQETRNCQSCKKDFVIEPDDFAFYERIKVPPPTWCSTCRLVRRLVWRNERTLYQRKCALCDKGIISVYDPSSPFPVYCRECWWSDKWDATEYGVSFDESRPFFRQYADLLMRVPRAHLWSVNSKDADYANFAKDASRAYLSYSVVQAEDSYYSKNLDNSSLSFDCFDVSYCEQSYNVVRGEKNHSNKFTFFSRACVDSWFLYDCANCTNCFMCSNLRNKQFHIRNKPYSREGYQAEIAKIAAGSFVALESLKREFRDLVENSLHKYAWIVNCTESTGNELSNSRGAYLCFNALSLENVRYGFRCLIANNSVDITNIGRGTELMYECVSGGAENSSMTKWTTNGVGGFNDISYTDSCASSSYLFGCVGLRNKQYCILNKQYTKEEYEKLVPQISRHMDNMPYTDAKGRAYQYGEFFPAEIAPFAYNETIAQEFFPLTKERALEQGFKWRDPNTKQYQVTKRPEDLPDDIKDVGDEILKETIGCAHGGKCTHQCTTAFKIIGEELSFYRRINLPLPRLCPNCRHYERLSYRNPLHLWRRQCMCDYRVRENSAKHPHHFEGRCPNEFETSYAPDRPEIVYCEACYQAEVV